MFYCVFGILRPYSIPSPVCCLFVEGTRLKMQSVCSLLGIKYNLDADDDDSLDVELHPILNMPYYCLPCKLLAQPNGQWLDIKNPILRYLLKYTSFTNLTQEELLELSDESPYIE